ncbi:MAG: NHLP leader peptide family natural product precursor [Chloroflexi bacterium]|nr:NHLP leader peptide family natural product precursor [Chloroflexota bacterium]
MVKPVGALREAPLPRTDLVVSHQFNSDRLLNCYRRASNMATNNWEELQAQIIASAFEDEAFRAGVMDDPKAAIAAKFGVNLPAELDIQVHEDTATTTHLVLPATGKLDEAALQLTAGGWAPVSDSFSNPGGYPRDDGG